MAYSVSRSDLFAGLMAAAILAVGTPALAKKKAAPSTTAAPSSEGGTKSGAAQAADVERPKPVVEGADAEAPKADEQGNVAFQGAKTGKGKITVKAPPKSKVYLEGKYFGTAPRTINKIPPGDYIVEIVFPDGKNVSRPVSVSSDEEAVVELDSSAGAITAPVEKPASADDLEKRTKLTKLVFLGAGGALALGLGFGVWEYTVQQDYNKAAKNPPPNPNDTAAQAAFHAHLDSIARKGDRLALVTNVCFVLAGAGVVAGVILGYPVYKARKTEKAKPMSPENLSFMILPNTTGGATAGMALRF